MKPRLLLGGLVLIILVLSIYRLVASDQEAALSGVGPDEVNTESIDALLSASIVAEGTGRILIDSAEAQTRLLHEDEASAQTCSIIGQVSGLDEGDVIADMTVVLMAVNARSTFHWEVRTSDAEGSFEFELPSPLSVHSLFAVGNDEWPRTEIALPKTKLLAGEHLRVFVRLGSGTTISGRVADEQGNPVPGSIVELDSKNSTDAEGTSYTGARRIVRVDSRGYYEFKAVGDRFEIRAYAPGFVGVERYEGRIGRAQSIGPLNFELRSEVVIAGTVRDTEQGPISGARVSSNVNYGSASKFQTSTEGIRRLGAGQFEVRSGPDGTFELSRPPASEYVIGAEIDGFNPGHARVDAASEYVNIELRRASAVRGRILGPSGAPLQGATIRAKGIGWRSEQVRSDDRGVFQVECSGEIGDSSRLCISADGMAIHVVSLRDTEELLQQLPDIILSPESLITGWIVNRDGSGLSNLRVRLRSQKMVNTRTTLDGDITSWEWDLGVGTIVTDANGRFELDQLVSGLHRIDVFETGNLRPVLTDVIGSNTHNCLIEIDVFEQRFVHGQAIDLSRGAGVETLFVREGVSGTSGTFFGPSRSVFIDDGVFGPLEIDTHTSQLLFDSYGLAPELIELDATASGTTELVVRMQSAFSVRFRLDCHGQRAPAGIAAEVFDTFGSALYMNIGPGRVGNRFHLGMDGAAYIHGLKPGLINLSLVNVQSRQQSIVPVMVPEDIVDGEIRVSCDSLFEETARETSRIRLMFLEPQAELNASSIKWVSSKSLIEPDRNYRPAASLRAVDVEVQDQDGDVLSRVKLQAGGDNNWKVTYSHRETGTRIESVPIPVISMTGLAGGEKIYVNGDGYYSCSSAIPQDSSRSVAVIEMISM